MSPLPLLWTLSLALALPQAAPAASDHDPVIEDCEVISIENQAVPGSDPGILVKMNVREGDHVAKDTELGRVDDREAQAQQVVKKLEFDVAQQEANSKIQIEYAQAEADVAAAAHKKLVAVNAQSKNSVAEIEVMRAYAEKVQKKLGVDKAGEKNISDKLTARSKKAEADAAQVAVERRILRAPFDGVVVKVYKHVGEWVAPGDDVVRLVRIDRLRVSGNLDASKWTPAEIEGRPVTIEVKLPRGETVSVPGRVVFASPVVVQGQLFEVSAEIDTPMVGAHPVVRAGLEGRMTIHVSEPAEPAAAPEPAKTKGDRTKSDER